MGTHLSTSALVAVATVLLIVMAVLVLVADDRLKSITGYNANSKLTSVHDKLVWAQVLAWIAAGLALLLALGYVVLHFLETSEWLHLILWILTFASLIGSGILLAIVLSDVDNAKVSDNKGITSYIWGALIVGAIALLVLLISGGWRVAHKQYENTPEDQYYMAAGLDTAPPGPAEMPNQYQQQQPQVQVTTGAASNYAGTNYAGTVPAQI